MNWVNFHEIRAQVTIEQVLRDYYHIDNLKVSGRTATGPCPVHGGDNPRAFHVDLDKNLWHCFTGCKKGGNQLDLVAAKDQVPVREAALRLQRFFLGGDDPPPATPAPAAAQRQDRPVPPRQAATSGKPAREEVVNPPLTLQLQLLSDHPHILQDRGLSLPTAERFGIGYCARGILAGCIAIPIHDQAGQLVAYAGRRLKWSDAQELGKYRFPKGFHKDRVLYGLDRALREFPGRPVVVVEGFFSVMKLSELGIPAVAVMGSDLSDHQAALLSSAPHVILMFDGDEAGRRGSSDAEGKLIVRVPTTAIELPDGWEPESVPADILRWLVDGATRLGLASIAFETWATGPKDAPQAALAAA